MHKMVFNVNGKKKIIIILSLNNEFPHTPATVPSKLLIQMIWMIHGTAQTKLKHLISSYNFLSMNDKTNKKRSVINKKKKTKYYMDKKLWDHFGFLIRKSVFMWFIGLSENRLFTLGLFFGCWSNDVIYLNCQNEMIRCQKEIFYFYYNCSFVDFCVIQSITFG